MAQRIMSGTPARQLLRLVDAARMIDDDLPLPFREVGVNSDARVIAAHPLGQHLEAMAGSALAVSFDHFRSALAFVRFGEMPAFAQVTLFRSAHELAIRTEWMLDSAQTIETRIARGCGIYLADLDERAKFDKSALIAYRPPAKPAHKRIDDLRTAGREHGMLSDKGFFPGETIATLDLFKAHEPAVIGADGKSACGSTWWRLLSAFAHGKNWPIGMLDHSVVTPATDGGVGVRAVESSDVALAAVATRAGAALRRAFEVRFHVYGVDVSEGVRLLPSSEVVGMAD